MRLALGSQNHSDTSGSSNDVLDDLRHPQPDHGTSEYLHVFSAEIENRPVDGSAHLPLDQLQMTPEEPDRALLRPRDT